MLSTHLLRQGWYHDVVGRLDAVTELVRVISPGKPAEWTPDPQLAAELVRATGMAAGSLAHLLTALGQEHAAGTDQAAVAEWRAAVQHLHAVNAALHDVPPAIRQHQTAAAAKPASGMFESRYGGNVAQARAELLEAARTHAAEAAHIAEQATGHTLTLSAAVAGFDRLHRELTNLADRHPLAPAVTPHGDQDHTGAVLARFTADLQYIVIRYQNLETIPAAVRNDAEHDLAQLGHSARRITQLAEGTL